MRTEDVLDVLIKQIEDGCPPWRKPWESSTVDGLPTNALTRREYSGTNVLLLWATQSSESYETGLWVGYEQAHKLGGRVRPEECKNDHPILVYSARERVNDDGEVETYRFFKVGKVFNVAQCDGIEIPQVPVHQWEPLEAAETLIDASKASIRYQGDKARYSPTFDVIELPERSRFPKADDFYGTSIHELHHWTGHESRLNREFAKKYGTDAYAFEELVAEIGTAMTLSRLGLLAEVVGHASYLSGWLKVLKQKPSHLLTAASAASKASDYLMNFVKEN